MAFNIALGFDRGNARTNVASIGSDGKFVEIDASSVIARANIGRMKIINAGASSDSIDTDNIIVDDNGTSYIFGDFALQQGIDPTTGFGDVNRYHGPYTLRSLYAYSSLMASKIATSKYGMPTELNLTLVMGVPVQYYKQESALVKDAFEGKRFTYKFNERDVTLMVPTVRVFMEGAGAAIAKGLSSSGLVAVVDTGSFTTNVMLFDGMKPLHEYCEPYEVGVGTALKMVSDKVEERYGRALALNEREALLRATLGYAHPPTIYADGVEVSYAELNGWMTEALAETANSIYTRVSGLWGVKKSQFKSILHVGGGSLYLQNHFLNYFKRAERPQDAEKYNARGYAILADQLAQRAEKVRIVKGA